MAESLVRVCHAAVSLIQEEIVSDDEVRKRFVGTNPPRANGKDRTRSPASHPLARAQSAGSEFSGVAADRVASTTRNILNAVSFPRFVTELINGVFKAMVDSSMQQMNAFVELLNNVSASLEGFTETNMHVDRARLWLVDKFPDNFQISQDAADPESPEDQPQAAVTLRDSASMPSSEALRTALGVGPDETIPSGDPENLVPFARRQLSQTRQQMLATMVMLGMQRIVVENGRITAAMRFHIDTRSAAQAEQGSTFDFRNQVEASGKYGVGPWGVEAKMTNTIGYVNTQRSQTTEEMNTDLDLNSSVEINFKSDYLPLNRVASQGQADRIRANSLNPDEEARIASQERTARRQAESQSDAARRTELDRSLNPARQPQAPAAGPGQPAAQHPTQTDQRTPSTSGALHPPTSAAQPPPVTGTQHPPTSGAQQPPAQHPPATTGAT